LQLKISYQTRAFNKQLKKIRDSFLEVKNVSFTPTLPK